jgi:hypothetical protein
MFSQEYSAQVDIQSPKTSQAARPVGEIDGAAAAKEQNATKNPGRT